MVTSITACHWTGDSVACLQVLDEGVRRIHDADGGIGTPFALLAWHWMILPVYVALFYAVFVATTPACALWHSGGGPFPWLTLVQKHVVWFNAWEALGLGVQHGPLHNLYNPPFQAWWYVPAACNESRRSRSRSRAASLTAHVAHLLVQIHRLRPHGAFLAGTASRQAR